MKSRVLREVKWMMEDPDRILDRIEHYKRMFLKSTRIYEVSFDGKAVFIGDLHGDFNTLGGILDEIDELMKNEPLIVFLGDYIDRGSEQLECLLCILELKRMYPENIHVLRGNHEPPPNLMPYPHDFPLELKARYGYRGVKLYRGFFDLFQLMPLSIIIDSPNGRILCLHGGLPTETYEKASTIYEYLGGNCSEWCEVYTEILWNDPIESDNVREPSPRGAGYLWGYPVTRWVSKEFGVELVVRGHEPCINGYKLNHEGRVLTLFSRVGPPYFNAKAGIAVIDLKSRFRERIKNCILTI